MLDLKQLFHSKNVSHPNFENATIYGSRGWVRIVMFSLDYTEHTLFTKMFTYNLNKSFVSILYYLSHRQIFLYIFKKA